MSPVSDVSETDGALAWPELIPGTLVCRYKRFLADVQLENGDIVTAHCANSGRMTECCLPGQPVWLSFHDKPARKLKYTWELIQMPTSLTGVNTQVPNRLVAEAVRAGQVPELVGYDSLRREVRAGERSRLDLLLLSEKKKDCFVEIKNCTLVTDGLAMFPDAVTARGKKHLEEAAALVQSGKRCVMFFLIQRMDAKCFRPADEIDPAYGRALRQAVADGVEMLAYDVFIDLKHIRLNRRIPVHLT